MCTEYNTVEALQTNISLADLWLKGMAVGAKSSGRTVQQLVKRFRLDSCLDG